MRSFKLLGIFTVVLFTVLALGSLYYFKYNKEDALEDISSLVPVRVTIEVKELLNISVINKVVIDNKEEVTKLWQILKDIIHHKEYETKYISSLDVFPISGLQPSITITLDFENDKPLDFAFYEGHFPGSKPGDYVGTLLYYENNLYKPLIIYPLTAELYQLTLREVIPQLALTSEEVILFTDKLNKADIHRKIILSEDKKIKISAALKLTKIEPQFHRSSVKPGPVTPFPFYSIELRKGDLAVDISWLDNNVDYLYILLRRNTVEINPYYDYARILLQPEHTLLNLCEEIMPVPQPQPPDVRYFYFADSARITKENMGLIDVQMDLWQIHRIIDTILRKDLVAVEGIRDEIPMLIEFQIEGKKEIMKITENHIEYFGKKEYKPGVLIYVVKVFP